MTSFSLQFVVLLNIAAFLNFQETLGTVAANTTSTKFTVLADKMSFPPIFTTISVVSHSHVAQLGEGPYWNKQDSRLYYVDALTSSFHRLDPSTGNSTSIKLNAGLVSVIVPYDTDPGNFVVTNANRLLKLNWDSGNTEVIATMAPELGGLERFNDAKCDPLGRLFIGTVLESGGGGPPVPFGGSLYKLVGTSFIKMATGFTISNGMAWSNESKPKKFFFNDSEGQKIYIFDYDLQSGTLSNQRVFIDAANHPDFVENEYPDGMAMDPFGFIWVAMWNGRRVVRINPETARVVHVVEFPRVQIPSSLAFGPYLGKFGFYVTTASTGILTEKLQDEGKIHHVAIEGGKIIGFRPNSEEL